MELYSFVVNHQYDTNMYVVVSCDGQCAIIDPACVWEDKLEVLKKFIEDKDLRPVWLISTHGHFDHVIGNALVCKTWPVKNAAHRGDLPLMEDLQRKDQMFEASNSLPTIDVFLEDGDCVTFGDDVSLQVLHIPGHSPGSIALYSPEQKWIISGDTLFRGSVGRTDIPFGNYDLLIDSIKKKMLTLPPETVVYPGHGPKTSIEWESKYNPYLKI